MALKSFTVPPRPVDPCPHQCGKWARRLLPEGNGWEPLKNGHNPNCPEVYTAGKCGYCGSTNNTPDDYECVDCGGV